MSDLRFSFTMLFLKYILLNILFPRIIYIYIYLYIILTLTLTIIHQNLPLPYSHLNFSPSHICLPLNFHSITAGAVKDAAAPRYLCRTENTEKE